MYYYAVVDIKDIVQYIEILEEEVAYSDYVPIATEDYTLVGKWYDRYGKYGTVGAFLEPPISVLAEHSTGQISYKDQDVWLDEKLDSYATTSSVQSALNAIIGGISVCIQLAKCDHLCAIVDFVILAPSGYCGL